MVIVDNITGADVGDVTATESRAPRGPRRRRPDVFVVLATALVLVPTIAAAVSALRNPWIPTNDWALVELQVRKVGTGDTPLVGAWSRFGWQHPGPLPFYLLALPYRLVPADRGLLFAAAVVNLAAVLGYVIVVIRQTRSRALIALIGLAVVQRGLGIDQLADPWNPTLPILPFALYVVLCLEIAMGSRSRWPLPVAVGVASFVVQAHIGFAQPVVLLGVAALVLRWLGLRRERSAAASLGGRPVVASGVVFLVAWLAPLIDQVNGSGNLGNLVRWSFGGKTGAGMGATTEGRLSTERVANAASWLLDPLGMWIGRYQTIDVFGLPILGVSSTWRLLWLPVVLVAAYAVTRWGRAKPSVAWGVVCGCVLAAVGAVATVSDLFSVRGAAVFWPFRWVAVVVMLVWVAVGWSMASVAAQRLAWIDEPAVVPGPRKDLRTLVVGGLSVAVVAVPVVHAVGWGTLGHRPEKDASAALLRLQPAIEKFARQEELVVANTEIMLNPDDLGLPVVLERAGIPWVELDDPRALGRRVFTVGPASSLDDVMAWSFAQEIEVLARSGPPQPGEGKDSELVLLRTDPRGD